MGNMEHYEQQVGVFCEGYKWEREGFLRSAANNIFFPNREFTRFSSIYIELSSPDGSHIATTEDDLKNLCRETLDGSKEFHGQWEANRLPKSTENPGHKCLLLFMQYVVDMYTDQPFSPNQQTNCELHITEEGAKVDLRFGGANSPLAGENGTVVLLNQINIRFVPYWAGWMIEEKIQWSKQKQA
jgi:hypothetical protein